VLDAWRNNASLFDDIIKNQEAGIRELKQKKLDYAEMIHEGAINEDFETKLLRLCLFFHQLNLISVWI
jgi:hypothetical protein